MFKSAFVMHSILILISLGFCECGHRSNEFNLNPKHSVSNSSLFSFLPEFFGNIKDNYENDTGIDFSLIKEYFDSVSKLDFTPIKEVFENATGIDFSGIKDTLAQTIVKAPNDIPTRLGLNRHFTLLQIALMLTVACLIIGVSILLAEAKAIREQFTKYEQRSDYPFPHGASFLADTYLAYGTLPNLKELRSNFYKL